jgi:hypothetical protein
LKEGSGISDIWLQEHIAANIFQYSKFEEKDIIQYSKFEEKEKVALVLSPLWASFDSDMECLMPPSIQK